MHLPLHIFSNHSLLLNLNDLEGFGIVIMCAIALFVVVGFASIMVVKGKEVNYFVAGRSLPLWVVTGESSFAAFPKQNMLIH